MKPLHRFALMLLAAALAVSAPAYASASGRAVEVQLLQVSTSGGGGCDWYFSVSYVGMAGTCGAFSLATVGVHTSSCVAIPSTTARADAYVDYGNDHANGLTCAANTMQTLTPVTLITFLDL